MRLCIFSTFSHYNTISNTFKIRDDFFLFWAEYATFDPFHLDPESPSWDEKIRDSFDGAFDFERHGGRHAPGPAIGD